LTKTNDKCQNLNFLKGLSI